jgi:hypothetical protein
MLGEIGDDFDGQRKLQAIESKPVDRNDSRRPKCESSTSKMKDSPGMLMKTKGRFFENQGIRECVTKIRDLTS